MFYKSDMIYFFYSKSRIVIMDYKIINQSSTPHCTRVCKITSASSDVVRGPKRARCRLEIDTMDSYLLIHLTTRHAVVVGKPTVNNYNTALYTTRTIQTTVPLTY